ncbi:hypothetical protein GZH49_39740 [Nocardia terpenica]|uniref:hypothetical protein n=1 Tax=Nocardia terpenica TaxID=455432 RepID=UPI002FDF2E8A
MSRHNKPYRFRDLRPDTGYLRYRLDTLIFGLSAAAGFLVVFFTVEHFAPCIV